ncbi:transposase DNA-binding-containing protein [Coleofasciculus sp. F4-SAH-05]|uniref:transposase DNA-binding-containing protein n=1 Tax=Coleofasciculus sp. F4-SAH-05 TaxID=3069525 RepID=UPI004062AE52
MTWLPNKSASIPQASGDWAATQAAYDFWSSPHVKASSIIQAHQTSTLNRIKAEAVVIAPQDTTELNFTHHPSKKGMERIWFNVYVGILIVG